MRFPFTLMGVLSLLLGIWIMVYFLIRKPDGPVSGGIYRIAHPALGEFELYAGPVGRGVKGLDLEAVINRIAT